MRSRHENADFIVERRLGISMERWSTLDLDGQFTARVSIANEPYISKVPASNDLNKFELLVYTSRERPVWHVEPVTDAFLHLYHITVPKLSGIVQR